MSLIDGFARICPYDKRQDNFLAKDHVLASLLVSTYSGKNYITDFFASRLVESGSSGFFDMVTSVRSLKLLGCSAVNIRTQLGVVPKSFGMRWPLTSEELSSDKI
jgi:hypothetical protein